LVNIDIKIDDEWFNYLFFILIVLTSIFLVYSASRSSLLGEDEGFYYKIANKMLKGTYDGYRFDGSPNPNPILPSAICSVAMRILGNNLSTCKMITAIFGAGTIVLVYLSACKLTTRIGGIFAVAVLLSISYFTHFSLLFYTEIPIAFFCALIVYLALNNDKWFIAILLGVAMGIAYFTKMTALMFPPAILLYGILDKRRFKYMFVACLITAIIWGGFIFYNLQRFNYPLFPFVNRIWKHVDPTVLDPYQTYPWVEEFESQINPPINILGAFGTLPFFVIVLGITYAVAGIGIDKDFIKKPEIILFVMLLFFLFAWFFVIGESVEERHLSVLFPVFAIFAAIPFADMSKYNSIFMVVVIVLSCVLLFSAYKNIQKTSSSVRFPVNYIQSLEWIKDNTEKDSVIFTVYGGSVYTYGRRERTWLYENFSTLMTTSDTKYILDQLKSRDADYILLWAPLIADYYIVPQSNIYGVFTWQFANAVLEDPSNFPVVHSTQETVTLHVGPIMQVAEVIPE